VSEHWYQRRFGWIPRPVRQVIISVIGGTILLLGIIMFMPLVPGPGIVVIPIGLAILALEFAWAARWLLKIRKKAAQMHQRIKDGMFGRSHAAPAAEIANQKPTDEGSGPRNQQSC
jgi:uncharacterized protein (TIGR02611 family)